MSYPIAPFVQTLRNLIQDFSLRPALFRQDASLCRKYLLEKSEQHDPRAIEILAWSLDQNCPEQMQLGHQSCKTISEWLQYKQNLTRSLSDEWSTQEINWALNVWQEVLGLDPVFQESGPEVARQAANSSPDHKTILLVVLPVLLLLIGGFILFQIWQNAQQRELERIRQQQTEQAAQQLALKQKELDLQAEQLRLQKEKFNVESRQQQEQLRKKAEEAARQKAEADRQVAEANSAYPLSQGLYPETLSRSIGRSELSDKSCFDLLIMRNEIYARYGRYFVTPEIRNYFNNQDWYRVNSRYSDALLNSREKRNASTILAEEKSRGCW